VGLLEAERVPFVVVGGIAAGLLGEPRYTKDADFMVLLKTGNIQKLAQAARKLGFDVEPELADSQWHFSGYLRLWLGDPGRQTAVDLMKCNNDFLREVAFRARETRFCGLAVPLATPEDMILFKVSAWREKDVPDARSIMNRHRDHLDLAYLRRWADWIAKRTPLLKDAPARLEAILGGRPGPPAIPEPG